ncbi:MAG: DUF4209 domain-containing protein [Kofleriaceae bacterium]
MCAATKKDFARLELGRILEGHEQTCFCFSGLLDSASHQYLKNGDRDIAWILELFSVICSYGLRADDGRTPFHPRAVFHDRRTASIEDLNEEELSFLTEVYTEIRSPELRARVADVLYVRRRHHDYARVAIDAYLESSDILLTPDGWLSAHYLLERALMLSNALKSERDRVAAHIIQKLEERRGDTSFFSAKLMRALLDARVGDPALMSSIAEQAAASVSDRDWNREHEYLDLAALWSRRSNRTEDARRLQLASAESYVKLADDAESRSLEAVHLERAIQTLRRIGGAQARVEELHARLINAAQSALGELREHSQSLDIGRFLDAARAEVSGKTLSEAVISLALMWRPRDLKALREAVVAGAKKAVMRSSIPRVMVNAQGKVTAKRPSLMSDDKAESDEALRLSMFERAAQQRELVAIAGVKPAAAQIVDEHYLGPQELMGLASASGFVPLGREEVFAVGLAAGFNGDFATALHLLMPQFENAIRVLLAEHGAVTSRLDEDGVQDERSLNELLYMEKAKEVFDAALLFDMQGLLVERWGGNLRNRMAHGLLEIDQMVGGHSIYFWWLTLHLVVLPLISMPAVASQNTANGSQSSASVTPTASEA